MVKERFNLKKITKHGTSYGVNLSPKELSKRGFALGDIVDVILFKSEYMSQQTARELDAIVNKFAKQKNIEVEIHVKKKEEESEIENENGIKKS